MDGPLALIPIVLLILIPLVAILGGITGGIIKTTMRQRLLELAQRERIAAIERGIDPEKLPPITIPDALRERPGPTLEQRALRRSHLLMIWGLLVLFFGIAVGGAMGIAMGDREAFGPAVMFATMGAGMLAGSRVGRPSAEDVRRSVETAAGRREV
jgi:hypothetical protein